MEQERKQEIDCIQQAGWIISYMTTEHVWMSDGEARNKLKWEDVYSFFKKEGSVVNDKRSI